MSELSGTWYGTFGWVGASLYTDEGDCILRIKEDGTLTWTVTPSRAANNPAKAWTWSGTAVDETSSPRRQGFDDPLARILVGCEGAPQPTRAAT